MTRQAIIYILILLVGLAGGTGIGVLVTQKKVEAANSTIEQLKTQQTQAESDLKAVNAKLSRLETELTKSRNDAMRKNTELLKAQTDLERMKSVLDQALNQGRQPTSAASAAQTPTTRSTTSTAAATRPATPTTAAAGVKEYTIKDGDSLWKIAANELGNGMRYKDILAMNPDITENTTLTVGSKIKIPAK